jgi:hypothetical protein
MPRQPKRAKRKPEKKGARMRGDIGKKLTKTRRSVNPARGE